jgi:hypothetical protein
VNSTVSVGTPLFAIDDSVKYVNYGQDTSTASVSSAPTPQIIQKIELSL